MDTSSIIELAVIAGLTEMVGKGVTHKKLRNWLLPLVSVCFGVLVHLLIYQYTNVELVNGLILGLTSAGLYSAGKRMLTK